VQYDLHPLCTFFPRLEGAEFRMLCEDISANGQREPITLHEDMVLDGGNRYRACIEVGVEPRFVEFDGADIVAFVLSANLHRRHLSAGQHAAIVSSVTNWAQAHRHGGDRKSDQGAMLHLDSVAGRAAASGASIRTQKTADKVAKADPELAKDVGQGKTTLAKAAEQVGAKPRKPAKAALVAAPAELADYDPRDDQIKESSDTIAALAAENDRLKDRIAVEAWDVAEEEKLDASKIISDLRAEVAALRAERDALIASRDKYQDECAQMKRQLAAQRREIQKLRLVA